VCMPDTPAALIERGKVAEGRQALIQIRGPWWVGAWLCRVGGVWI